MWRLKGKAFLLAVTCALPLLAVRCASSTPAAQAPVVDIQVEQLPDSGFAVQNRGAVSTAYQMSVRNRSNAAITLRKVEMRTVGRSPYLLRNEPAALNETIEPGKEAVITFSMWSYSREKQSKGRSMVWVSGNLHFDGPAGASHQEFSQSFREPSG